MGAINFSESVSKQVIESMGTGEDSQCVQFQTLSGHMTAGCFEIICSPDKQRYTVLFDRKDFLHVECSKETEGDSVQVGMYMVKCVDPGLICRSRNTKCPFDCFFRGKCRESGVCTCNFFFEGDYCEREKSSPKGLGRLWRKVKEFNGF